MTTEESGTGSRTPRKPARGSGKVSSSRTRTTGCSTTDREGSSVILAVTCGRGEARNEIGLAAVDVRYPHIVLCQISDYQTYINTLSKIYIFDPSEIVMPDTVYDRPSGTNKLYRRIKETFPRIEVVLIGRMHFNKDNGLDRVRSLCAAEYTSVELFVKEKSYALSSAAALLKYAEFSRRMVYAPRTMKIEFEGSPNTTVIGQRKYEPALLQAEPTDIESAKSLELVASQCGRRNASLLGVLDRCSTPMGRRLLRTSILQPSCDQSDILQRQEAVAELASSHSLRATIQPVVRRLFGASRLLTVPTEPLSSNNNSNNNNVQSAERNLNYILLLKNSLDIVPELRAVVLNAGAAVLRRICRNLENTQFERIREKILELIHPDARSVIGYTSSSMQRCFAIKAGINDLLDIARQTYCELIDDMKSMVERLAANYRLPLTLACNGTLGYHIQAVLPRNTTMNVTDIPPEFIEVQKKRNTITMSTNTFLTMSQQCRIACEELHLMSNVLLCDLLMDIRGCIGCLFQLCTDVAELDLVTSLAEASSGPRFVRPSFADTLDLKDSTHPIMDTFGTERPVPNSVRASVLQNVHVITGPNMSGKSTYLKQIVLVQIMAQMGCYVPAEEAKIRIADRILCKICVRDDLECNASTFAFEMKEAQYILQSVGATSLVVLDELCRSTTSEEGCSIAWAICEYLQTGGAFVFSTTHFADLTRLADLYPNVVNYYFETRSLEGETDRADHFSRSTHRLRAGRFSTDGYGIALAEISGLARHVTEKAREFAQALARSNGIKAVDQRVAESSVMAANDVVLQIYELTEMEEFDLGSLNRFVDRLATIRLKKSDPIAADRPNEGSNAGPEDQPEIASNQEVQGEENKENRTGDVLGLLEEVRHSGLINNSESTPSLGTGSFSGTIPSLDFRYLSKEPSLNSQNFMPNASSTPMMFEYLLSERNFDPDRLTGSGSTITKMLLCQSQMTTFEYTQSGGNETGESISKHRTRLIEKRTEER